MVRWSFAQPFNQRLGAASNSTNYGTYSGSATAAPAGHSGTEGTVARQASPGVTFLEHRTAFVRYEDDCAKAAVSREPMFSLQTDGPHGRRPPTVAIPERVTGVSSTSVRGSHARRSGNRLAGLERLLGAPPKRVTPIQHPQWRAHHARYLVPTLQNRSERIAHATGLRGSDVEYPPHLATDEWRDNVFGSLPVRTEGPRLRAKTKRGRALDPVSSPRFSDVPRVDGSFSAPWIPGRATRATHAHDDWKGDPPGDRD